MSGAAGIAAAKNRRSRTDPISRPSVVDCKSINGACAPKNNNQQQQQQNRSLPVVPPSTMEPTLVDPVSMKILGPMPTPQVLKVHEQRLNRIDEQLLQCINRCVPSPQASVVASTINDDLREQLEGMEDKIHMLEEVIMNLQLTITSVQGFAMETNLAMMKMKREQEEREEKATTSQDISKLEVEQLSDTDTDTNIDVSALPSSVDLTDIVDTIHNDEIVVSNITFTLNAGC